MEVVMARSPSRPAAAGSWRGVLGSTALEGDEIFASRSLRVVVCDDRVVNTELDSAQHVEAPSMSQEEKAKLAQKNLYKQMAGASLTAEEEDPMATPSVPGFSSIQSSSSRSGSRRIGHTQVDRRSQ